MNPTVPPVFLVGAPHSGVEWLGEIVRSAPDLAYRDQPLLSYAFKDGLTPASTTAEMRAFLDAVAETDDPFVLYGHRLPPRHPPHKTTPRALVVGETRMLHLLERVLARLPAARVVAVIRCPLGVLASWCKDDRDFDPLWTLDAEWREAMSKNAGHPEHHYGFEAWLDSTLRLVELQRAFRDRVHLVAYGALLADPVRTTEAALGFCGVSMSGQTRAFLDASRGRGLSRPMAADDDWHGVLPDHVMQEVLERIERTPAERWCSVTGAPV